MPAYARGYNVRVIPHPNAVCAWVPTTVATRLLTEGEEVVCLCHARAECPKNEWSVLHVVSEGNYTTKRAVQLCLPGGRAPGLYPQETTPVASLQRLPMISFLILRWFENAKRLRYGEMRTAFRTVLGFSDDRGNFMDL